MKNLLKLHENLVIFPLKFSQDFHGFWFHSVCFTSVTRYLIQDTERLIFKNLETIRFVAKLRVHKRFDILVHFIAI